MRFAARGRVLPQDRGQRLLKNSHRDTTQVEDWQEGIEAARPPRPFRQDSLGEADPLLGRHIGGAVTHLRALDVKRSDPGLDAALRPVALPDNPLAAIRQDLLGVLCNEGVGLGLSAAASIRRAPSRAISVSGSSTVSG